MPVCPRRHETGRHRRRMCGHSFREGLRGPRGGAGARDWGGHAGAVRADAGRALSSEGEKSFFGRERVSAVLGFQREEESDMAVDIVMPQMGESIFEGTITKWLKKTGDKVERDEPLFEISTDKVDAEIPSPSAGVLKEIKVGAGQTVPVQTIVGVIDAAGSAAAAPAPAKTAAPPPSKAQAPASPAQAPATPRSPLPAPAPVGALPASS